jgi:ABC-type amino acid transport substrate-binding protein
MFRNLSTIKKIVYCMILVTLVILPLSGCKSTGNASTTAKESILDRIIRTNEFKPAIWVSQAPWAYYDANNNLIGYDVDVVNMIAKDLGVTYKPIILTDPSARVSSVLSGEADLVAGIFSLTPERSKSIAFTPAYAPDLQYLMGRKDQPWKNYTELTSDIKVAILVGSTNEQLPLLAPQATYVRFNEAAAQMAAMEAGQVDAYIVDITQFNTLSPTHPDWELKGIVFQGILSLGLPRNDPEWLRFLDDSFHYHMANGDLPAIYKTWFKSDMPVLPGY